MTHFKPLSVAALLVLTAGGSSAFANNCEQVKADIAAKIDANGVQAYSLTLVDPGATHDGKVVGHCGGNTKHIVYVRGASGDAEPAASPAPAPAAEPAQTQAGAPASE